MAPKAGKAVVAALRDDIDRLLAAEPDVRADAEDSVHQMRVATRRLRSVLRSYRRLFHTKRAAATEACPDVRTEAMTALDLPNLAAGLAL